MQFGYCNKNSSDNKDVLIDENSNTDNNNKSINKLKNKDNNKGVLYNSKDNNNVDVNYSKDNNIKHGNTNRLDNSNDNKDSNVNMKLKNSKFNKNKKGITKMQDNNLNTESDSKFNRTLFENAEQLDTSSNEIKKDIENSKIQVTSEKSNFNKDLWIVKKEGSKSIAFTIRFRHEGRRSFKDNSEMLGLVLNTMFEGTKTKTGEQIKELIDNKSLIISFYDGDDDIVIRVKCLSKYFNDVMELLGDLLANATFPEDKVQAKKDELILSLKQCKFSPHYMAQEKLYEIALPEEYSINLDKAIKTSATYTSKYIIENCYNKIFNKDNAVITIAGDILDNTENNNNAKYKGNESVVLKSTIISEFNKLYDILLNKCNKYCKLNPFKDCQQKTELNIKDKYKNKQQIKEHVFLDNPQAVVLFALPGVARNDKDKFAISAANTIFGAGQMSSRLMHTVRYKDGLVYGIGTMLLDNDAQAFLRGIAGTSPENINNVIDEIKKQINIFYEQGITENELKKFKINWYASYNFPLISELLAFVETIRENNIPVEQVNDYINKFLNLDIKEINRALKKVFDPKKLVFVSCGRKNNNINTQNENNKEVQPISNQETSNKVSEDKNTQKEENNKKLESIVLNKNTQINIQDKVLKNGLRVIVAPINSPNSICCGVGYFVGSADDPRNLRGISHFLEHMMFGITKNFKTGEITNYLDKYSRYNNAFTSFDVTFYTNQCNKAFLELFLQVEAERMVNIKFDNKEIEHEMGAILEERNMRLESNPASRYIFEDILKSLYLYSPYSEHVIGYTDQIKSCTAENLKKHYDLYYMPNNAFVLFVGDITLDKAVSLCEKYFGHIEKGPEIKRERVIDPERTGITKKITHKSEQLSKTEISIFYKIPRKKTDNLKKSITISIASNILVGGESSILHKKLVESKKLVHSISGNELLNSKYDASTFSIDAVLQEGKNIYEVEKEINKLIKDFGNKLLTKELFEIEKQKVIDSIDLMLDSPVKLNDYIIYNFACYGYSLDEIRNIKNIVNSINYEEVKMAANDIFDISNQAVVLYQMPDKKAQETNKKNKKENIQSLNNKKEQGQNKKHGKTEEIKNIVKNITNKTKDNLEVIVNKTKEKIDQVKEKVKERKKNKQQETR